MQAQAQSSTWIAKLSNRNGCDKIECLQTNANANCRLPHHADENAATDYVKVFFAIKIMYIDA